MVQGAGRTPLSKLDILIAQLQSISASASAKSPDPLICFDLLSDLLRSLDDHPKEIILGCQRKCEDALQALLVIGARPPIWRLCAENLIKIISKGDTISIYSRASSLQGLLLDNKKIDAVGYIGLANCLGALYRSFGQKLTSGLSETSNIVVKLIKFPEVSVRKAALQLLQDALEGLGGGGPTSSYSESLRAVLRIGAVDKSPIVRTAAASCLRAFALAGGPGIGTGGIESCSALCVKVLEDLSQPVRYAFAAALGALLALGLHPDAQIQLHDKTQSNAGRTVEGGIQKYLIVPFVRATGPLHREVRVGLTMAWVSFLQGMHFTYGHSDFELQNFAIQAIGMLSFNSKSEIDAHCQACVLYIIRVGIVEQMSEQAQKEFLTFMAKQLSLLDTSASMLVVILRTISHLLSVLGEVSSNVREALENSLVMALSNSSIAVRAETALTIQVLTEVDPFCANSLMSFGVTTIRAVRDIVAIEKGDRLKQELDSLHGQALMLGAILSASSKLPLGLPSWLPAAILDVAKRLVQDNRRNPASAGLVKEAGWLLVASVIMSMRKEEMQEEVFDIIALWTIPFGGNSDVRLREAESNLLAEICGWSAAIETLTAFVKCYVVPNLSTNKESILLQPVLGYLNVASTYLTSTKLHNTSGYLKQAVDAFTMRTLMAYRALPDSVCYSSDHDTLLGVCTSPFRDPATWGESSCLRQLLDSRDSSLGPWIPGRDAFEDELRAFDGGSDGPPPCVWDRKNISVFPQPFSVSTLLLNEFLLCFGSVFVAQKELRKLQLLDILEGSLKLSKKQSYQEANGTNVCVALLASVKETLRTRSSEFEPEVCRRLQLLFQGIMAEESSSTAQRRAAAEGLGILARLGNDVFAARLMKSILADVTGVSDDGMRGSFAFALGCIHRSKGGMALSVLVPATVQVLCLLAKDHRALVHRWSLHSLWLTIEAAGLAYVPHVQVTMSLVMEILLSEDHSGPEVCQCLGRLINAIVAVIGPELSPGSSFFTRCKSVIAEISSVEEPASLLESVLFTQQLVLFAPQAVSFHMHVQTLTPTLWSKQPSLRQAAVSALRHLAERDPASMIDERIEEKLFAMLDVETDPGIIKLVRMTLVCLLEAACPMYVFRWLHLCRNVVLATSSTIAAGSKAGIVDVNTQTGTHSFGDDEEGMIVKSSHQHPSVSPSNSLESKLREGDQLPRYGTRLFAAECLVRLPTAVGDDLRHFNLLLAMEDHASKSVMKPGVDWLVIQLGQLVALAYQVATGVFESLRPTGVSLLVLILQKFGETMDPDFGGHLLLEQYQAQFVSAIRTALDFNSSPRLLDVGLHLSSSIITSCISNADVGVFRSIMALMSQLLINLDDLQFLSYAEWVGCKVQISLLRAYAVIKCYSYNCMTKSSGKFKEGLSLWMLLADDHSRLIKLWIGLLKDFLLLKTFRTSQLQHKYTPFLGGLLLPAVMVIVQPYLEEVWPEVLEAVISNLHADFLMNDHDTDLEEPNRPEKVMATVCLSTVELDLLWALCFLVICKGGKETIESSSYSRFNDIPPKIINIFNTSKDYYELVALQGIHYLLEACTDYSECLTMDLSREVFQIVMQVKLKSPASMWQVVLPILKQLLLRSPDEYFANKEWLAIAVDCCMYHAKQILSSVASGEAVSNSKDNTPLCLCFDILVMLARRSPEEGKILFVPVVLFVGLEYIKSGSSFLSAAVNFVSEATNLVATLAVDQKASILASLMLNISESLSLLIEAKFAEENIDEEKITGTVLKVSVFLELVLSITGAILGQSTTAEIAHFEILLRQLICEHCISCFLVALKASQVEVQLAALHTLRSVVQSAVTERNHESSYELSLLMMRDLGTVIVGGVYLQLKIPLTTKVAASIGERLKLLVLLYSLLEGDQAQVEILHILLPAIIAAASGDMDGQNQIIGGLRTVSIKLVTHLASQPVCATQLKSVLLDMPTELRQKLQDILRASVSQKLVDNPQPSNFPTIARKLVVRAITPVTTLSSEPREETSSEMKDPTTLETDSGNDDDDDDDWDDFQSYPLKGSEETTVEDHEVQSDTISEITSSVDDTHSMEREASNSIDVAPKDPIQPIREEFDEFVDASEQIETFDAGAFTENEQISEVKTRPDTNIKSDSSSFEAWSPSENQTNNENQVSSNESSRDVLEFKEQANSPVASNLDLSENGVGSPVRSEAIH